MVRTEYTKHLAVEEVVLREDLALLVDSWKSIGTIGGDDRQVQQELRVGKRTGLRWPLLLRQVLQVLGPQPMVRPKV